MIGVIAHAGDQDVVREFFELFKTPWQFYQSSVQYEVLLCAGDAHMDAAARLVLVYCGKRAPFDDERRISTGGQRSEPCILEFRGSRIPLYGHSISFSESEYSVLTDEVSQDCIGFLDRTGERAFARIGYDLFSEVRSLLTVGQPAANAKLPALELHIAFLRELITRCGISLYEIPPVPDGYRFIACLTHDVDHPLIRRHKWDHTIFGFLYRAVFGSFVKLIRGQLQGGDLLTNWLAVLKLPFIYLGLAKDFWGEFADKYLQLEKDLPSTFFLIPFREYPGKSQTGLAPTFRASAYGARDIADLAHKLLSTGHELGLHGIDAWIDSSKGYEELEEIRRLTEVSETGVRMHWLYFNEQSHAVLEKTGAAYDSTMGYNETVGYRVGTTQAYKPLEVSWLLELPMHAMDTAMFYPAYLGLSAPQARMLLNQMAENAVEFGGVLTVNWHDRSIAPERLWSECYRDLIQDLRSRGAWFATAQQAVSWFRKRRSVIFEGVSSGSIGARAISPVNDNGNLPGLLLRVHKAAKRDVARDADLEGYIDKKLDVGAENRLLRGAKL